MLDRLFLWSLIETRFLSTCNKVCLFAQRIKKSRSCAEGYILLKPWREKNVSLLIRTEDQGTERFKLNRSLKTESGEKS